MVLALPAPSPHPGVDLDLLDCLQQGSMSAVCAGATKLPTCYTRPQEKAEKVFMMCEGGGDNKRGVGEGVICWGCNVWHR